MARKSHSVPAEQARYAREFLASLKTPEDLTRAAKKIAAERGIKVKSARRNLERYTAGARTLKGGKQSVAKQKRNLEKSHNLPPIIRELPEPIFEPGDVELKGDVQYSEGEGLRRNRKIIFSLKGKEMKAFLAAGSKRAQANVIASIPRFANFDFQTIDAVNVLE